MVRYSVIARTIIITHHHNRIQNSNGCFRMSKLLEFHFAFVVDGHRTLHHNNAMSRVGMTAGTFREHHAFRQSLMDDSYHHVAERLS